MNTEYVIIFIEVIWVSCVCAPSFTYPRPVNASDHVPELPPHQFGQVKFHYRGH